MKITRQYYKKGDKCSTTGCNRMPIAKGLCKLCYNRLWQRKKNRKDA